MLSGMGELHLDIIKDRLLKEYDVAAYMGPLQVAYRESIDSEIKEYVNSNKSIAGTNNSCNMVLVIKPHDGLLEAKSKKSVLKVVVTKDNGLGKIRRHYVKAIHNGIVSAFSCGPLLNFPVIGVRVELHWFETTNSTSPAFISSTTSTAVTAALKKADISLLEPVMKLEITAPTKFSTKIITDLSSRRSQLGEVSERNNVRYIEAVTPLSDLVNYSSVLRTLSSGTATLSMQFLSYKRMTESEKRMAKEKVTGFAS
jgi:elongation factor G